jgi:AcrR family transcriptional regulator
MTDFDRMLDKRARYVNNDTDTYDLLAGGLASIAFPAIICPAWERVLRKNSAVRTSENVPSKSRAGRPTKKRVEAIGATILATALEMFLDAGYSVTSMDAIAARAGISKGTLYARYPNKAALFTAIVEDRVAAWSKAASVHDAELPPDLAGRLRHHVRVSLEGMADPEISAFAGLITAERKRFPELARIYHERAVGYEIEMLAAGSLILMPSPLPLLRSASRMPKLLLPTARPKPPSAICSTIPRPRTYWRAIFPKWCRAIRSTWRGA